MSFNNFCQKIGPEGLTLLAIDAESFPLKRHLCPHIAKPDIRREPVLRPGEDKKRDPDADNAHFYGTVIHDQGKFRLWYYGGHAGRNPDLSPEVESQLHHYDQHRYPGPLCYAESNDGLNFEKPSLGTHLFKGDRDNNALDLPYALTSCALVIKDDQDPNPARRYKMVFEVWDHSEKRDHELTAIRTATSADGISWENFSMPYPHDVMEPCGFYRHGERYIIHSHAMDGQVLSEGGHWSGRQGYARLSSDFNNWLPEYADAFLYPEPLEPHKRSQYGWYDQVHLGVAPVSYGNVAVGLYGIWHNRDFYNFGDISCDLGLVISHDGLRFHEPVKGHRFIASEDSPVSGNPEADPESYHTILCQANGILNHGEETLIYHGRWQNNHDHTIRDNWAGEQEPYGEIALAKIPRDRWGSLRVFPKQARGSVWSSLIEMPEYPWTLSVNGEGLNDMRFEIADENLELIPEFSGDKAGRVDKRESLDEKITWQQDLSRLSGQSLCFKIVMEGHAAQFYALYLRAA